MLITVATTASSRQRAALVPVASENQQRVIAVEHRSRFIDELRAIGVAVERHAHDPRIPACDLGLHRALASIGKIGRAAAHVDARTVIFGVDRDDRGAPSLRRNAIGPRW